MTVQVEVEVEVGKESDSSEDGDPVEIWVMDIGVWVHCWVREM